MFPRTSNKWETYSVSKVDLLDDEWREEGEDCPGRGCGCIG